MFKTLGIVNKNNMKIEIYINGLIPITWDKKSEDDVGGSRVFIKIWKDGLKELEKIINADEKGELSFFIPDTYAGANILIRIRNRYYKPVEANLKINNYGLFYTAKIEHDYTFWSKSGSSDPEWNSQIEYDNSDKIRNQKLRKFRFKNISVKVLYYFFICLSIAVSFLIPGGYGVIIVIVIVIILELISPYSIGLKKLAIRNCDFFSKG